MPKTAAPPMVPAIPAPAKRSHHKKKVPGETVERKRHAPKIPTAPGAPKRSHKKKPSAESVPGPTSVREPKPIVVKTPITIKDPVDKGPGKIMQIIALYRAGKTKKEIVLAGFNYVTVAIQVAAYLKHPEDFAKRIETWGI